MEKVKALYGFSPDLESFAGKSCMEQAELLASWGCNAIFGGYQNPDFVDAVHNVGMEIYAEFGCFVGASWWDNIPSSRPVTDDGQLLEIETSYAGVNPASPEVRAALLKKLEDLLIAHDIDGVWLDYIRWPCHWEVPIPHLPRTSFDPATLARFSEDTGVRLPESGTSSIAGFLLDNHSDAWSRWRCDQITSWVAAARQMLNRTRPGALLGLFGVPWRLSDLGGAILKIVGQDYGALAEYIDVFSPMVYHAMCSQSIEWIGAITAEVHRLSGKPVWPIVQSIDEPRSVSAEEYGRVVDVALKHPDSSGVLVFTLAGALDAGKLAVTREQFARD